MTTFVLAALVVLLCGPDALHYAKGAPHRWQELLWPASSCSLRDSAVEAEPDTLWPLRTGGPDALHYASGTYLQVRHDSLLVAEADTLRPRLIGGRCPFCVKLGWKSQVDPERTMITAMGWRSYYDEAGRWQNDDPNIITSLYKCSKGHRWEERNRRSGVLNQ